MAIQQPDVRRRRSNRREGFGTKLGELRSVPDPHPPRHASHVALGGSDGGRLRPCLGLRDPPGQRRKNTHAERLERHCARGSRANQRARPRPLAHVSRDEIAGLLDERMWRELHRPQAEMPESDQPEVRHRYYALGWIHESYRGHPLVAHNGSIDGFVVHLGFLPETGQGLILLMNRDLATEALMAMAYSAYDRLLGLEPLNWEQRLEEMPTALPNVRETVLDFPIEEVVGRYEHPAYGALTVRAEGDRLVMQFRNLRSTLVYQGERRFLGLEPIADGVPQITVRFSKPKMDEPAKLFVPLNFDAGDPVEVLTRVSITEQSSVGGGSHAAERRPLRRGGRHNRPINSRPGRRP